MGKSLSDCMVRDANFVACIAIICCDSNIIQCANFIRIESSNSAVRATRFLVNVVAWDLRERAVIGANDRDRSAIVDVLDL